jgi:hypothetical protein
MEWFAATDPERMLEFLYGKMRARQIRLFYAACAIHR